MSQLSMSQQSICVNAVSRKAWKTPGTPLLEMNYSHFEKLAKKQAKREEHNVESAKDYSLMEDVGSLAKEAKDIG